MSRRRVTETQEGFAGGVNTTADDLAVSANQLRRAENARLTLVGAARKRGGTRRMHAAALNTGAAVRGGFCWVRAGSVQHLVVAGGQLYVGTWTGDTISYAASGAVAGTGSVCFVSFRGAGADVVYFAANGALYKWTGAALSTVAVTGSPTVTRLAVYNQRLFAWSSVDETVIWSGVNDGDTLNNAVHPTTPGGNAIVRTFGDADIITGVVVGGALGMLHRSGISRFSGLTQDDINIAAGAEGITGDVGTTAPDSVVGLETMALFLSDRGVYSMSDNGVQAVLGPLDDLVATLTSAQLSAVRAAHSRVTREVWFMVPGQGVYVYNYRLSAWAGPWTGGVLAPEVVAMWEAVDANGSPVVLLGDASGWVRRADVATSALDNVNSDGTGGATFTMLLRLRRFFAGEDGPALDKSLRWVYVVANLASSLAVQLRCSTRTGTFTVLLPPGTPATWGSGAKWGTPGTKWGGRATRLERLRVPVSGRGEWLDIDITDTSASAGVLISRVECEAFALARRG